MVLNNISANALSISMLVEGFPVAAVEYFGETPLQWTDREIAERYITPDNKPVDIIKNASYICTLSLMNNSILDRLLKRVCGDEVGRKGFKYKSAPRIQMTVLNLAIPIPEVYTQGIATSVPAGSSVDNTKYQDSNYIIAFHERKL
ncbi:hypothetical protein CQA66_08415 [Helicobacter aurati]|uniref:Uncharacterized protein n=2 Tax=Helicobacter aurati TaxID=137778 RepID=A0A3D8IYS0_9HELI|nr:hypothetical protein CQA66_08415 [Helicobacter aurati]